MAQQMDPSYYANLSLGAPPPGVIPNFNHPPTRAIEAHIGMGVCIGIASIFVILRIYTKLAVTHMWGLDDLTCLIGFALSMAYDAILCVLVKPGGWVGVHIWDIRVISVTTSYIQLNLAVVSLYSASAFFVKTSLFLLYYSLFKPNKTTRWLVYVGITACGLFYSATIVINWALCIPRPGQPSDPASRLMQFDKCLTPIEKLNICQGVFGTLSDIYLLVIPIQSIFKLHLSIERKTGVSAVFLIGIIAIICSLGNLGYRAKQFFVTDITWFGVSIYIFSAAEVSAGIVCSCLPILPALLRGHTPKKFCFLSLRYFSFRLKSSRRPYLLNDTHSLNNLHAGKLDSSSGHDADGHVSLEGGTVFEEPNKAVLMARDY